MNQEPQFQPAEERKRPDGQLEPHDQPSSLAEAMEGVDDDKAKASVSKIPTRRRK